MSDERELTSEQETRVRRLLAEARVDAPMPEDVVTRLDAVLARLGQGEPVGDHPAVVDLASRRRRKVTTMLAAAAAVVVVGVGLGQVVGGAGSTGDSDSAADGGGAVMAEEAPAPESAPDADSMTTRDTMSAFVAGAPEVRESHFADDVARIAAPPEADGRTNLASPSKGAEQTSPALICDPADWGQGLLQLVRYEGQAAVLAFRAPIGTSQVVDLLQCGTGETLRSVTLPVD